MLGLKLIHVCKWGPRASVSAGLILSWPFWCCFHEMIYMRCHAPVQVCPPLLWNSGTLGALQFVLLAKTQGYQHSNANIPIEYVIRMNRMFVGGNVMVCGQTKVRIQWCVDKVKSGIQWYVGKLNSGIQWCVGKLKSGIQWCVGKLDSGIWWCVSKVNLEIQWCGQTKLRNSAVYGHTEP